MSGTDDTTAPAAGKRRRGRPRKGDRDEVRYDVVDRLIVYGEQTLQPDGHALVRYPSFREIARRFGVSHAVISRYAKEHRCLDRRDSDKAQREAFEAEQAARDAAEADLNPAAPSPVSANRAASRPVAPQPSVPAAAAPLPTSRGMRLPMAVQQQLDSLLVTGEPIVGPDGATQTVHFPSHRAIAQRLGIATSTVTDYSARHNCKRRRAEFKAQLTRTIEERVLEIRGERIAITLDEILNGIDEYARQFHEALRRREVRTDSPADYDRLMRLRFHMTGGPDARVEVHTTFSLEAAQSRYAELLGQFRDVNPIEAGVIDAELVEITAPNLVGEIASNPPAPASADHPPHEGDRSISA